MGNRIPAVDMIVNDFIRPINQAYAFHDYRTASQLTFVLNSFLRSMGFGIKDLPDPTPPKEDFEGELKTDAFFQEWFEEYYDKVMKMFGYAIKRELVTVIAANES
jgi:hypothetical protein